MSLIKMRHAAGEPGALVPGRGVGELGCDNC